MRYLAVKEGWDGRRIVPKGTVFNFDGPRGSWMVPCDQNGNPIQGEEIPAQRPLRAGAKQTTGQTRDAFRARCKELGISFNATMGAPALAELIQKHEEEVERKNSIKPPSPENPDGGAPGLGSEGGGQSEAPPGGTGNIEVL